MNIQHLLKFTPIIFLILSCTASQPESPQTNESEFAWIVGTWVGEGFGGTMEETWSLPSPEGTLMGMFRHLDAEGNPTFYEFMLLDKEGIRLKHFNPDLSGWEEKNKHVTFEMVRFSHNKIEMNGLIYELKEDGQLKVTLEMKQEENIQTEIFNLKRKTVLSK